MSNSKKCSLCSYSVPDDAKVCGHCGANFVWVKDKSVFGRIKSGVKIMLFFGIIGFLIGAVAFGGEAATVIMILAGIGGFIFGLYSGDQKQISR